jgi:hypothetical protein
MAAALPVVHQVPDWETPTSAPKKSIFSKVNISTQNKNPTLPFSKEQIPDNEAGAIKRTFSDKWIPLWCAPCAGRSRKTILCGLAAIIILIALILGLGLGLGLSHKLFVTLNTFHPRTAI